MKGYVKSAHVTGNKVLVEVKLADTDKLLTVPIENDDKARQFGVGTRVVFEMRRARKPRTIAATIQETAAAEGTQADEGMEERIAQKVAALLGQNQPSQDAH
jgi:hypothetical protein